MKALLKAIAIALPIATGALTPGSAAFAQQQALPSAEPSAVAERQRLLTETIARAIPASRLPQIYADLRAALATVYLPGMRDMLSDPKAAQQDPESLAKLSAAIPLMDYALRAANELDPVLAASQAELIGDIAALQAKYASLEEIRLMGEMLDAPATSKGFSAVYALTRCITGYDQADLRSSQEISAWMKDFKFDAKANPFGPSDLPPPSPAKVAKAGAIVSDFLRVSRLDDMVADIIGFTRNVVLQVDALKAEEVEAVRAGLQQVEFYYNLRKAMALAIAPSGIAAALTDDELAKLHRMVLSPAMAKSFGLITSAVREGTSFTKQDITDFRRLLDRGEKAGEAWRDNPERQARMTAEWGALAGKWRARFKNSLSPDTRKGLDSSLAAYEALVAAEKAKAKAQEQEENGEGEHGDNPDKDVLRSQPGESRRF